MTSSPDARHSALQTTLWLAAGLAILGLREVRRQYFARSVYRGH